MVVPLRDQGPRSPPPTGAGCGPSESPGVGRRPPRAALAKCRAQLRRPSRRRTGRGGTRRARCSPSGRSSTTSVRSNFAAPLSTSNGVQGRGPASAMRQRRVLHGRASPGTAGVCVRGRGAAGAPRPACSNGSVLVRVRGERARRARAAAARGTSRRRDTSARSTSVLTKKPISASVSRARAVGDRRADEDVAAGRCSGARARRTRRAGP